MSFDFLNFEEYCEIIQRSNKKLRLVVTLQLKGGYNIFDVFVNNYLWLVKHHSSSIVAYKIEKFRLFYYFVLDWCIVLFLSKKRNIYKFEKTNWFKIIFAKYGYEPYFYIVVWWKILILLLKKYNL